MLFAGPHKSASSSVQEFFMRYASNQKSKEKHPALINWTWPYNPRRGMFLPRKGFAPLVSRYENEDLRFALYKKIYRLWNNATFGNIILGSEEFDRFGATPWSHRNSSLAIRDILQFTRPRDFRIVVNYRTPRHEQWISIWKQLTRTELLAYKDYLCEFEYLRIWEYLDSVANPLGLVQHFRKQGWNVTLIDMMGVARDRRDVAHVVACEVLKVPCHDGWLDGPEQIFQNTKSGDPGVSDQQLIEMEWLFRLRDCAYRESLEQDPGLQILHRYSLWHGCPESAPKSLLNTTLLLNLLQNQVGCGDGSTDIPHFVTQALGASQNVSQIVEQLQQLQPPSVTYAVMPPFQPGSNHVTGPGASLAEAVLMQTRALVALLILTAAFFVRNFGAFKGFRNRRQQHRTFKFANSPKPPSPRLTARKAASP